LENFSSGFYKEIEYEKPLKDWVQFTITEKNHSLISQRNMVHQGEQNFPSDAVLAMISKRIDHT